MPEVIYVKKACTYEDVVKNKKWKKFSRIIYCFKKLFHRITKQKIENKEFWILPELKEKEEYFSKYLRQFLENKENVYLFSSNLITKNNKKIWKENNLSFLDGSKIRKFLIFKILDIIMILQGKKIEEIEVAVLVNYATEENVFIIKQLLKKVKSVKIVSPNLYQFKKLEETMEKEGIAMQLSQSYRKSLAKAKVIINLDRREVEVREYQIFSRAILIQCAEGTISLKDKLFNGIVVNSCDIELKEKNEDYENILFYESLLIGLNDKEVLEKIEKDKVEILALIGSHGEINEKEFKNLK